MKKAEIFYDAMTGIRESIVEEVQDYRFRRRSIPWRRYAGLAACLALVVCIGYFAARAGVGGSDGASGNSSGNAGVLPGESENAPSSGGSDNGAVPPGADGAGQDGEAPAEGEDYRMAATVLEVHETYLLVEPVEGDPALASADRFAVSVADVEDLPELKEGDRIAVTYDGFIRESYPAQITASGVELLE